MANTENPTTTADTADANALRIDSGTNTSGRTWTAATPFFRLPREIRDEIYQLASLGERTIYYEIALGADEPPQKTAHVHSITDCACSYSRFGVEYDIAARDRVDALLVGGDRGGSHLVGPGPPSGVLGRHTPDAKLELWKGRRSDGTIGQNIHALRLFIPFSPRIGGESQPRMHVTFKSLDNAELGPRLSFDCSWTFLTPSGVPALRFPSDDGSALRQLLEISRKVN